jgi:hypothetical protein
MIMSVIVYVVPDVKDVKSAIDGTHPVRTGIRHVQLRSHRSNVRVWMCAVYQCHGSDSP